MFWNDTPDYLKTNLLTEKWSQPKFDIWVTAKESAEYFEARGDKKRAQEIRKIQEISGETPVYFVLAPKWVAAYVTPWSSKGIYYNLDTLATGADHEHIITHEKIHLKQQAKWWNTDVPGFRELPPEAKALFASELGMAVFDERAILEWCTENLATEKTRFDKRCSYNQFEVPVTQRLDALVSDVTWMSLTDQFAMMSESGSRSRFRRALLQTANYLVLAHTAKDVIKKPLKTEQQLTIRAIGNYVLRKPQIIRISEAKSILLKASADLIRVTETISGSVDGILGNQENDAVIIEQWLSIELPHSKTLLVGWISDMSVEILKKKTADKAVKKIEGTSPIVDSNERFIIWGK